MGMKPLISIVMPVYNAAAYLEEAVRSVIAQNGRDWALILVDDGSADGSGALCDALAQGDERISVIHMPENVGLSGARNAGMAQADGKYLMFLDADDWIEADLIERLEARIRREDAAQLLVWGVVEEHFHTDGQLMETRVVRCDEAAFEGRDAVRMAALDLERKTLLGYAWNKLYDMDMLRACGAAFEKVKLIEDILFNLDVIEQVERMETLDFTPYHYARRASGSLTHGFLRDYYPLSLRRIRETLERYEKWGLGEAAGRTLAPVWARYTLSALQRNCDPQAGMRHADRVRFAKEALTSPLYRALAPYLGAGGGLSGIIERLMKLKSAYLSVWMGRAVYLVNTKMNVLFTKLSGQGGVRHEAAEHRGTQL